MSEQDLYDAVVVGGGAAGLSGAIALARSRRRVLVVDAGSPRNAPAEGVHNLLGREGVSPLELLAQGRADLEAYGGEVRRGLAVGARRTPTDAATGFEVDLDDGTTVRGRRLLVTTGLVDELPDVPGLAERWGHQVLHCPFCHGWEVRDQRIGVLATGPMAVHQAVMFSRLSDRVVLLAHEVLPGETDLPRLAAAGVAVVTGRVSALEGEPGRLSGVRLEDGTHLPLDAVVVASRMVARSAVLDDLGLEPVPHPSGMGQHYPADATGRTSVAGVFLAGNVADLTAQVGASGAAGTTAGAMVHAELIEEELAALLPV